MSDREQLPKFSTIAHVLEGLKCARRIIVIAGAGISVSCGIPDFRSPGTGLYESRSYIRHNIPDAQLYFDLEYFKIDPEPFYK
jgi:NAD-dependent SIR2 family protein deacetylase